MIAVRYSRNIAYLYTCQYTSSSSELKRGAFTGQFMSVGFVCLHAELKLRPRKALVSQRHLSSDSAERGGHTHTHLSTECNTSQHARCYLNAATSDRCGYTCLFIQLIQSMTSQHALSYSSSRMRFMNHN